MDLYERVALSTLSALYNLLTNHLKYAAIRIILDHNIVATCCNVMAL